MEHLKPRSLTLLSACFAAALVAACDIDSTSTTDSAPVVDADTNDLKNNAIAALGNRFDGNLSAVGQVLNDNADVLAGTTVEVVAGGSNQMVQQAPTETNLPTTVPSLVKASLATDESSSGVTTRSGNNILVDPDETELCIDADVLSAGSQTELDNCRALLQHVTVQLLVSDEDTGELTYLYKNQPMIIMGYSPNTESIQIDLGVTNVFSIDYSMQYLNEDITLDINQPDTVAGALKLEATVFNEAPSQEAGSLSFDVVQPVRIVNTNTQENISIGQGQLFAASVDAGAGTGEISFDLGAITANWVEESSLRRLNIPGISARADVDAESGAFKVSNFGLARGPLTMSVDNKEILRLALETFGFTVVENSDDLTIDGNLNLFAMIDHTLEPELDPSVENLFLEMMATSGTSLNRAGNGNLQIGGTGPFTITVGNTRTSGAVERETIVAQSGDCIGENAALETTAAPENCLF